MIPYPTLDGTVPHGLRHAWERARDLARQTRRPLTADAVALVLATVDGLPCEPRQVGRWLALEGLEVDS